MVKKLYIILFFIIIQACVADSDLIELLASNNNPPLPAEALSPASGASISATSNSVNLRWNAEDPDNDINGYDLYFGENSDPELFESDLENDQYNGIPVSAGVTYYWKVVTKDSQGNESISPIFSFTVG